MSAHWSRFAFTFPLIALLSPLAVAQTPQQAPPGEMDVRDESATFRSRVNLVMVPVVVRDKKGKATGDLGEDDFQLFDNGKPQKITRFSVEQGRVPKTTPAQVKAQAPSEDESTPPVTIAERYTIYLFDDVHSTFPDLASVRDAALRHLDKLAATDRAAIFTTSGQGVEDFTDDKAALRAALLRLQPHPIARSAMQECPDVTYYAADLVINRQDPMTRSTLINQTISCLNLDPTLPGTLQQATTVMEMAARRMLSSGEQEVRVSLSVVKNAIRRLASVPGQRTLLLASPGMYTTTSFYFDRTDIIDRAIRANVIINTLDSRGLWTDPSLDASRAAPPISTASDYFRLLREEANAQADILAELAYGTGGSFVHNSNDFEGGFRRLAGTPDYVYLLGFSPQNLKVDGKFHSLKVTLKNGKGLTLQSRRGYFAPKASLSAEETAKQEIEEALFSREEMRDIPISFNTQFFKKDEFTAKLTVLNRIDIRQLSFRKADGRNSDNLVIVTGLFDHNGNLITALRQNVEMKLRDETLSGKLANGLAIRVSFDVAIGPYAIRVVVRDSEGQLMSAANGSINIP